ncbi:MAG: hypothetical protein V4443_10965 [Pseudomonadota bacterium]
MNLRLSNKHFPGLVLSLAAIMLLSVAWVSDDAFITLRVIDNFINGWGLRYNVIERVQVYTHPLWLFFLTPFYALTREALLTTMLVSVGLSLGALWLLARRIAVNIEYGCLLVLVAVASGSISQFATSGLETPLTFLLLALLVAQLYQNKHGLSAALAGLLVLNRMDLAILIGPLVVYLAFKAQRGQRWRIIAAAFLPVLIWMIFSIIYYGSPFPNTAYAKLGTGYGTGELILQGLHYGENFLFNDPLLALLIGASVLGALRSRDQLLIAFATGLLLYIVYTIAIGGDFMSGRFFATPGFLALCLLARLPAPRWLLTRTKLVAPIIIAILALLLVARSTQAPGGAVAKADYGIVDERSFYYLYNGLPAVLNGWLATGEEPIHPWGHRGTVLRALAEQNRKPVMVITGTIGMRGYYGGPMLHIMDELALADPFLARLPAQPGSRVGHYLRAIPPGYSETVLLVDPLTNDALQPLLNDVVLATRAPLFADGRWGAVWRLLSGHYRWGYASGPESGDR